MRLPYNNIFFVRLRFSLFGNHGRPVINNSILLLVVAEVVKKSVNSRIEDIRTPNYLDVEESTWKGVSDFVFIPKETVMKAQGSFTRTTSVLGDDVLGHSIMTYIL